MIKISFTSNDSLRRREGQNVWKGISYIVITKHAYAPSNYCTKLYEHPKPLLYSVSLNQRANTGLQLPTLMDKCSCTTVSSQEICLTNQIFFFFFQEGNYTLSRKKQVRFLTCIKPPLEYVYHAVTHLCGKSHQHCAKKRAPREFYRRPI